MKNSSTIIALLVVFVLPLVSDFFESVIAKFFLIATAFGFVVWYAYALFKDAKKNIPDNHLLEMNNLIHEIKRLIENDYSHVSKHLPDDFKKSVYQIGDDIDTEISKREL